MDAITILEQEYLEIRARLLQVGAALDRIDRADGNAPSDARLKLIRQAIDALSTRSGDRAEQIQLIFSLPYDSQWQQNFKMPKSNGAAGRS